MEEDPAVVESSPESSTWPPEVRTVHEYLCAMEARHVEAATQFWAHGQVDVRGVGGTTFRRLEDMVAASSGRYQVVKKHKLEYRCFTSGPQVLVVSTGHLHGRLLDGTAFDDVRYADLFTLRDGAIVQQEVYNDFGLAPDPGGRR